VKENKAVPELLTVDEAAQYIHMGRTTFYECIRDGSIAFIRPPKGKILVRKTVLDTWLSTYEVPARHGIRS
jgi:excisionase family DNA binding protein